MMFSLDSMHWEARWIQEFCAFVGSTESRPTGLFCNFHFSEIDQLGSEIEIDPIVARYPAVGRAREGKKAVGIGIVREPSGFIDDLIGRRNIRDLLRHPNDTDFRTYQQISPLP